MTDRPPRERYPAVDVARIRQLAPVLSATALERWFDGLPPGERSRTRHGLVTRSDGIQIGTAKISWHASTLFRYTTTASVTYTPLGEHPTAVNVRGRQKAIYRERTADEFRAGTRFDPDLEDIDHIGQERYPLVWCFNNAGSADLTVVGARLKVARDPTIARVQQDSPLSVEQAEDALLAFGGILVRAAGIGEQGLLFGSGQLFAAATS